MCKMTLFLIRVICFSSISILPSVVNASEWSFDTTGRMSGHYSTITQRATDLVPIPVASGYSGHEYGLGALLQSRLAYGSIALKTQFRLSNINKDTAFSVDEAYLEYQINDQIFGFVGRRILSYGQAYGLNPVDVFHDPMAETRLYPSAQARNDVQGVDMVGVDFLFANGGSFGVVYAPEMILGSAKNHEDLWQLQYAGVGAGGALDYTIFAYGGNRPGAGLSASYGIGDASVLYLDATFRRGRQKRALASVDPDGALHFGALDTQSLHPFITLGWGHTFASGFYLNLEYTHDSAGYSDQEWQVISEAIDIVTPVMTAQMGQSLGQLNGMLNQYTLRQDYGFMRLAHDGVLGTPVKSALTVLHGFNDSSGSVGLRIEYPVNDVVDVGLYASQKYGSRNSEFMLRPNNSSLSLYATVKF